MTTTSQVSESVMLVAKSGDGAVLASEASMLVAYRPPSTYSVNVPQSSMLVSKSGEAVPRVSETCMLVAYGTGSPEDFRTRGWAFTQDGHQFYVLHLGTQGTWVYDLTTGQWGQWQTEGHVMWNMEVGTQWFDRIIAGDSINPLLWELQPAGGLDEDFKPIKRRVTGGLSVRQRIFPSVQGFTLTASVGQTETEDATITLSYSDDQGRSYVAAETLALAPDDPVQELSWRSLGVMRSPGRIFVVEDTGGLVRVSGADATIDGE